MRGTMLGAVGIFAAGTLAMAGALAVAPRGTTAAAGGIARQVAADGQALLRRGAAPLANELALVAEALAPSPPPAEPGG